MIFLVRVCAAAYLSDWSLGDTLWCGLSVFPDVNDVEVVGGGGGGGEGESKGALCDAYQHRHPSIGISGHTSYRPTAFSLKI